MEIILNQQLKKLKYAAYGFCFQLISSYIVMLIFDLELQKSIKCLLYIHEQLIFIFFFVNLSEDRFLNLTQSFWVRKTLCNTLKWFSLEFETNSFNGIYMITIVIQSAMNRTHLLPQTGTPARAGRSSGWPPPQTCCTWNCNVPRASNEQNTFIINLFEYWCHSHYVSFIRLCCTFMCALLTVLFNMIILESHEGHV